MTRLIRFRPLLRQRPCPALGRLSGVGRTGVLSLGLLAASLASAGEVGLPASAGAGADLTVAGSAPAARAVPAALTASGLRSQVEPGGAPPAPMVPALSGSASSAAAEVPGELAGDNLWWFALSLVGALLLIGSRTR